MREDRWNSSSPRTIFRKTFRKLEAQQSQNSESAFAFITINTFNKIYLFAQSRLT